MFKHFASLVYGFTNGVFAGAEAAATSSAGIAACNVLGYTTFNPEAIFQQTVIGNSFASGIASTFSQDLMWCGLFRSYENSEISLLKKILLSSAFIGFKILSGMIGQLIEKFLAGELRQEDEAFHILALGALLMLIPMWGADKYFYKNFAPQLKRFGDYCDRIYLLHEEDDAAQEDETEFVNSITYSPRTIARRANAHFFKDVVLIVSKEEEDLLGLSSFEI
jgi:hypothetical protein